MKRALLILFVAATLRANASDYVVIANASMGGRTVTESDLRQIFLGVKTSLDGKRVEPVVAESGAAHAEFASGLLGKTTQGLKNYYRMLVFSGKGSIPKSLSSDAAIVAFVAQNRGAIGYVHKSAVLRGVVRVEIK